jgi:hypothetical protein
MRREPSKIILLNPNSRIRSRYFPWLKWRRRWSETHVFMVEPTEEPRFRTCCEKEDGVAGSAKTKNCHDSKCSSGRNGVDKSALFLYESYPSYNT